MKIRRNKLAETHRGPVVYEVTGKRDGEHWRDTFTKTDGEWWCASLSGYYRTKRELVAVLKRVLDDEDDAPKPVWKCPLPPA